MKTPFQWMLSIIDEHDAITPPTPEEWAELYNQILCTTCTYVGEYLNKGVKPTGFEHDIRRNLH